MRRLVLAAALAALGLTAAGCGGSRVPALANLDTTRATSPPKTGPTSNDPSPGSGAQTSGGKVGVAFSVQGSVRQMLKFSTCMRANGEPSFPNPNAQGVVSAGSLDRDSPQFEQGLQACRKDLPGGRPTPAQQELDLRRAIAFSICMRQHGEPNYPDPKGGVIQLLNIDQNSPQFQRAQALCQKKVPNAGKG